MKSTMTSHGTPSSIVAIGNFDGVHLGHQSVLTETARKARNAGLKAIALTFEPHPTQAVGRPAPACLTPVGRKVALITRLCSELEVIVKAFDEEFAQLSPEAFAQTVLVDELRAKTVFVGENFRFGRRRLGNLLTLQDLGVQMGFQAQAAPMMGDSKGRFSSTRVRQAIAEGDLAAVHAILSRPHALTGVVVEGQKRARHMGYPTANLRWISEALPPHGVYAVLVDRVSDAGVARKLGAGVCNIGVRPTVDAGFAVEAHVFGLNDDLYGQHLRVHLIHRIRAERQFASLDALRAQIELDADVARQAVARLVEQGESAGGWY